MSTSGSSHRDLSFGYPRRKSTSGALPGDRFIPRRRNSDADSVLTRLRDSSSDHISPSQNMRCSTVSSTHGDGVVVFSRTARTGSESSDRILDFSLNTPTRSTNASAVGDLMRRFSATSFSPSVNDDATPISIVRQPRNICTSASMMVDMPNLPDNFMWNIFDVNPGGLICVAVKGTVSAFRNHTGIVELELLELEGQPTPDMTSAAWDPTGKRIIVGQSNGNIKMCDLSSGSVTKLAGHCRHKSFVNSIVSHTHDYSGQGEGHVFYSGAHQCGCIRRHDLRCRDVTLFPAPETSFQLCNMALSLDGRYLCTGAVYETLNIWKVSESRLFTSIKAHEGPIKAMSWCPWQPNMLTTGGGYGDNRIRSWNIHSGKMLTEITTESEVCGLVYSEGCRELASAHGSPNNSILLWNAVTLDPVAKLVNHRGRVLYLKMAADKQGLISASGEEEMLMTWQCFQRSQKAKRRNSCIPMSSLTMSIR